MKLLLCIVLLPVLGAAHAERREQVSLTDPALNKAVDKVYDEIINSLKFIRYHNIQLLSASRPAGSKKVDYAILFNVLDRKTKMIIKYDCRARILLKTGEDERNKGEKVYYLEGKRAKRVVCTSRRELENLLHQIQETKRQLQKNEMKKKTIKH